MGRVGQLTNIVLGGIATVSQTPDRTPGQLLGHKIEDSTGQLTSGLIRYLERFGLVGFEIQFKANRDAEAVAWPTREGDAHDPQNEVQAPQRAVFLPGGASAIAVAAEPLDMGTRFFLGGIVEDDANDDARGDKAGRQTYDGTPELAAFVVEGSTKEHIEP